MQDIAATSVPAKTPEGSRATVADRELLNIYSHFQTDIQNVKQRQWRDFNATLAGQGAILVLWKEYFLNHSILFAILSFVLWIVGKWFLIENKEVLIVYRAGKDACLKELKKNSDLAKILEPPDTPIITGKLHHRIYSMTIWITTGLIITILLYDVPDFQPFRFSPIIFTAIASAVLEQLVPAHVKNKA